MRKCAILLLAAFTGTVAYAPAHVSHRGQVMSLRSSQSSDSFSSDTVSSSYCNIAFQALHATAVPNDSPLSASLHRDGEADTRTLSERTPSKKMPLRRHKLSRTVELY